MRDAAGSGLSHLQWTFQVVEAAFAGAQKGIAMQQLVATILADDIQPYPGLVRRFRVPMTVNNRNDIAFEITSIVARVYVDFAEANQYGGMGRYIADAMPERLPFVVGPGDNNRLTVLFAANDELITSIEGTRGDRDVIVNVEVSFAGLERARDTGKTSGTAANGIINDARTSQNSYVTARIAKSRWAEILTASEYSRPHRTSESELRQLIQEASAAKAEAETAARAAKEAATLTAVTNLADAYSQEARALRRRSWICLGISVLIAVFGAVVMVLYASESVRGELSVGAAILRAIILAAIFGVFTLSIRVYESYLHLEVVNRHRVNIGRTFEAFKAAQPTERAREIMSAITAEHMLAFGKSGFAPKDTPNQGPLPALTELIRSIVEKR